MKQFAGSFGVAAVAIGLLVSAGGYVVAAHAAQSDIPFVTPPGIIIVALGGTREPDGIVHLERGAKMRGEAYADARGLTLYIYDRDIEPGKSACEGECLANWPAAVAAPQAGPTGVWTIIRRSDGTGQWAYQDKPVHTFIKDTESGLSLGDGADGSWHALRVTRPAAANMPFGISVADVPDAGGQTLVDHGGLTLYVYSGQPEQDRSLCAGASCENKWVPLRAPALAGSVGHFSTVARPGDGKQWAYKSAPLYRFKEDAVIGDVTGNVADKRWQPAVVTKYPAPPGIAIVHTPVNGTVFATAEGKSLYRYTLLNRGVNDGAHSGDQVPALARALGTSPCAGKCLERWRPLIAAKDALPSGYWSILMREDGARQWAYKHYAVYSYVDDIRPGDLLGENTVALVTNDNDLKTVSMLTKAGVDTGAASGFYWTAAYP